MCSRGHKPETRTLNSRLKVHLACLSEQSSSRVADSICTAAEQMMAGCCCCPHTGTPGQPSSSEVHVCSTPQKDYRLLSSFRPSVKLTTVLCSQSAEGDSPHNRQRCKRQLFESEGIRLGTFGAR